jgi:excisionase family DNA binding protein
MARHRGFEPLTYGSGVAIIGSAPSSSGSQPLGIVQDRAAEPVQPAQRLAPNRTPFGPRVVQGLGQEHGRKRRGVREVIAPLLTVRQVAERLGVSTATVYTLVEQGELAHVRVSNAIRIPPPNLASFMAGRGGGLARKVP